MTMVRRQFTFSPRPKPGQAFASYIETAAHELVPAIDISTFLHRSGLTRTDSWRDLPIGYGLTLTDAQVAAFAETVRLPEPRVREMLLTHYDGIVFDLAPMAPETYRSAVRSNSALFTTQRLCPCCVAEDPYTRVAHRLPWYFLCSEHKVLLSHTCPGCARPHGNFLQSRGGMPSYATYCPVPSPALCRNPPATGEADSGRAAEPCGYPLKQIVPVDVSAYPRVLETQTLVEQVIHDRQGVVLGETVGSVEYFRHLRSVLSLLDYAADPDDLGPGLPPMALDMAATHAIERGSQEADGSGRRQRANTTYRTPDWMCAFLPKATELLALDSEAALADALPPLLDQARRFKSLHFRTLGGHFKFEGGVARAFDVALLPRAAPRRQTGHTSPYSHHPDRPYSYTPDHVPQMLWEDAYRKDFAALFEGTEMQERHIRSYISMDLIRLCGEYGWVDASRELGFLTGQAVGSANKAIRVLKGLGTYDTYLQRLHDTAACLEGVEHPFNFGLRRAMYQDLTQIEFSEWSLNLKDRGLHPGKRGGKNRWAGAHVWSLLTAGHPRRAPVFKDLSQDEYENRLEVFYRFNRDHLERLYPLIVRLALDRTVDKVLAGQVVLGTQETLNTK